MRRAVISRLWTVQSVACTDRAGDYPFPKMLPAFDLAFFDDESDARVRPAFVRAFLLGLAMLFTSFPLFEDGDNCRQFDATCRTYG